MGFLCVFGSSTKMNKRGLNIFIAGLSEKNWKQIVLRIELNFYHAINSKSLGSSSFPLFKLDL